MYKNPKCGHRKLRVRPVGNMMRAFCAKCGAEGADHKEISEAILGFRFDLKDAALKAAREATRARA